MSSTTAEASTVSRARSPASCQPVGASMSMSTTTRGVRNTADNPKLRAFPYGSSAARIPNGTSSHGPNGTTARMAAPRTAPATVPPARCSARANTEP